MTFFQFINDLYQNINYFDKMFGEQWEVRVMR